MSARSRITISNRASMTLASTIMSLLSWFLKSRYHIILLRYLLRREFGKRTPGIRSWTGSPFAIYLSSNGSCVGLIQTQSSIEMGSLSTDCVRTSPVGRPHSITDNTELQKFIWESKSNDSLYRRDKK